MNKFIWLFLLIACNPASPSSETKPSQLTEMSIFDQLISQATHIIRAEVTELEASFAAEAGVKTHIFKTKVVDNIKGKLAGEKALSFSIKEGHFLQDENGEWIQKKPKIMIGNTYILFLKISHDQNNQIESVELVDKWLGVFPDDPYLVHAIRWQLK